jgi:lysyl-tRNA synthetase class II
MKGVKVAVIVFGVIFINTSVFSCNKDNDIKVVRKIPLKKNTIEQPDKNNQEEKIVKQPNKNNQELKKDPFSNNNQTKVEKSKDDGKIITITGKLGKTKGAMATVAGKFLDDDFIKIKSSKKWKDEYEKMYGKEVEVRGRLNVYYCSIYDQCLNDGKMEFLKNIEYIKLKK